MVTVDFDSRHRAVSRPAAQGDHHDVQNPYGQRQSAQAFWIQQDIGSSSRASIILFTIILGVRRVVPTERHQGMVVALVAESIVKLVALLAVGLFVVYSMFDGFGDLFRRFSESPYCTSIERSAKPAPKFYVTWFAYLLLSMSSFLFLPRQFHVAVIENFDETAHQDRHVAVSALHAFDYLFRIADRHGRPFERQSGLQGRYVRAAFALFVRPFVAFSAGVSRRDFGFGRDDHDLFDDDLDDGHQPSCCFRASNMCSGSSRSNGICSNAGG